MPKSAGSLIKDKVPRPSVCIFSGALFWCLVRPESQENWISQLASFCEFAVFHLTDQLWSAPVEKSLDIRRGFQWAIIDQNVSETIKDELLLAVIKSCTYLPDIDQAVFIVEESQNERTEVFPGTSANGVAADYKCALAYPLDFLPSITSFPRQI